ncbi:DUF3379 family protein [Thiomicrorhabdus sp. ZW0627]|uniref:DUF3379 family protein n=1 Tax=Thiomicrorhabdus sp. ZW0627 TaxID=3039774 RepID=UPI002436E0D8|nr:DUF3379 family protein [Thiomicrorhabdus sp. ZW0627]MDG6773724.1 DUF3379 family protein [Thiomicrorhabdus sp. ZW0627]
MNELEFRKRLLHNPQVLDNEMVMFVNREPEFKSLIKQYRELDQMVHDVLKVEIPEGLKARILLNESYREIAKSTQKVSDFNDALDSADVIECSCRVQKSKQAGLVSWFSRGHFSKLNVKARVAASVLVAVLFVGLWQAQHYYDSTITGDEMVAHILDHMAEDPSLMLAQTPPHSAGEIKALFTKVGATLEKPIGSMSYAGECVIEGQKGLHIVMQDEAGPVTVIVMPGQQLTAMEAFKAGGYTGELIPVKGGIVAIVGNSMEQLALAQMRFFEAVRFA